MNDAMIEAVTASTRGPDLAPLVVLMMLLAMLALAGVIVALERKIRRERLLTYVPLKPPAPTPRGFAVVMSPEPVDDARRTEALRRTSTV